MHFQFDKVTARAIENYFSLREPYSGDSPLIAKSGYHSCEIGGFYKQCNLQQRMRILFDHLGLSLGD